MKVKLICWEKNY